MGDEPLYGRLGGYDGVVAVVDAVLPRLAGDAQLGRFWAHRGIDGIIRERQLLINFLASASGGQLYYTGRDMALTHEGMRIDESDWEIFMAHLGAALDQLSVGAAEQTEVIGFIGSLKDEIVEA
ncbi:MAG: group I truncated hemoglobin [Alphaproteobacteria bacterium]|jgi:hemoglobin